MSVIDKSCIIIELINLPSGVILICLLILALSYNKLVSALHRGIFIFISECMREVSSDGKH